MALSTAAKNAWANSQTSTTTLYKLLGIDYSFKQELGSGLNPSVGGYFQNFYLLIDALKDEAAVLAIVPNTDPSYTGIAIGGTAYSDLIKKSPAMRFETKKSAYDALLPVVSYLTTLINTGLAILPTPPLTSSYTTELAQFVKFGGLVRPEVDIYEGKPGLTSEDADLNFHQAIYLTIAQIQSAIVKIAADLSIALV